jgi:hypothetical protein
MEIAMANRARVVAPLPNFSSIEEAATFWDTHDSAAYEDEFEPVEVEVTRPLIHTLEVDFDGVTFQRLVSIAKGRGLGPAALVRAWVEQAIAREASSDRPGDA